MKGQAVDELCVDSIAIMRRLQDIVKAVSSTFLGNKAGIVPCSGAQGHLRVGNMTAVAFLK